MQGGGLEGKTEGGEKREIQRGKGNDNEAERTPMRRIRGEQRGNKGA